MGLKPSQGKRQWKRRRKDLVMSEFSKALLVGAGQGRAWHGMAWQIWQAGRQAGRPKFGAENHVLSKTGRGLWQSCGLQRLIVHPR